MSECPLILSTSAELRWLDLRFDLSPACRDPDPTACQNKKSSTQEPIYYAPRIIFYVSHDIVSINSFSAETVFIRQNLTSVDVRL